MMTSLEQRLKKAILANPEKPDYLIARSYRGSSADLVRHVRSKLVEDPTEELPPLTLRMVGISLTNRNVATRRPVESAAKFIKRLPNGRGFDPKQLAKEWGMSEETIRKHAKEMKCFKYVEVSEDEWVPFIVSPQTAAAYNS